MSWIEKLYKTYENNTAAIGDKNDETPLLPVSHTTQNAQITVVIDGAGKFLRAMLVPKPEARTIIPATEASAGRTNGLCPILFAISSNMLPLIMKISAGLSSHVIRITQSNWVNGAPHHFLMRRFALYVIMSALVK